jgi:hypothetical protein
MSFRPRKEAATLVQWALVGALVCTQVDPALVEM